MKDNLAHTESLLRRLVEGCVYHQEAVEISTTDNGGLAMIQFWVHAKDKGLVIGKGAVKIIALQTLIAEIGKRRGLEIKVKSEESIVDGPHGDYESSPLNVDYFSDLMADVASALFEHPESVSVRVKCVPNTKTYLVALNVSERESHAFIEKVKGPIKTIFDGIAKKTGNTVLITIDQHQMA